MRPLRTQFYEFMQFKNFSIRTIESYLQSVIKLSRYYNESPKKICQEQIFQYILHLQNGRKLAFSTCNVALSAFKL